MLILLYMLLTLIAAGLLCGLFLLISDRREKARKEENAAHDLLVSKKTEILEVVMGLIAGGPCFGRDIWHELSAFGFKLTWKVFENLMVLCERDGLVVGWD